MQDLFYQFEIPNKMLDTYFTFSLPQYSNLNLLFSVPYIDLKLMFLQSTADSSPFSRQKFKFEFPLSSICQHTQ